MERKPPKDDPLAMARASVHDGGVRIRRELTIRLLPPHGIFDFKTSVKYTLKTATRAIHSIPTQSLDT
jgi:hypothetical protein